MNIIKNIEALYERLKILHLLTHHHFHLEVSVIQQTKLPKHLTERHTSNEICILFAYDTQVLGTIFSSLCSRYKNFYFSFLLCLHQILQPDPLYILTHHQSTKKSVQIELQLSRY